MPRTETPTPLNAKPAPRITEMRRTVGAYEIHATATGYSIHGPGPCRQVILSGADAGRHDPQTNFQRAVIRLKNEGRIPEGTVEPL